jgi:hypothetical protein
LSRRPVWFLQLSLQLSLPMLDMGSRAVAQPKPSDATDRSSIRVDHSTLALLTRLFRGFATERSPGHGAFVGLSSSAGVEALGVESEVWRRLQKAAAIAKRTSMFPLSRRTLPAKQRKNLQPNLQKRQRFVHVCSVLQMPCFGPGSIAIPGAPDERTKLRSILRPPQTPHV